MMGETVARTITGKRLAYKPGFWFNSAKFFDIEYQTSGTVAGKPVEGQKSFYWEDPTGKICLHVVSDEKTDLFIGLNVFGMRLRHHVCDDWLKSERTISYVMEHLKDANFDPEFYKQYEQSIINQYNKETGNKVSAKSKSWARILNLS